MGTTTEEVRVPVRFSGVVTVRVPQGIPEDFRRLAAENWALAQVLATLENPDAPQVEAYEQYLRDGGEAVGSDWDRLTGSVCGDWEVGQTADCGA